jgi:transposase
MAVSVWVVRDELWEIFRELLPCREPRRTGRPRVEDRVAFNAVVYVLVTGIAWRHLPPEIGCSPATRTDASRSGSEPGSGSGFIAS